MQGQAKEIEKNIEVLPNIQLIVFRAGNEEFGVPIEIVQEIIKTIPTTPIPNSPPFIKGIINVRGDIVTILDVKKRFSLSQSPKATPKHIIVTKQDDALYGLMVDEVVEVLRIQQTEIQPPPFMVIKVQKDNVKGIVSHEGRVIIILDLRNLLSHKKLIQFNEDLKKESPKLHKKKGKRKNLKRSDLT